MRDYIILNGKRSTMYAGLLITSLPPITKPLLRTQKEEIDGRDGDIVTPVGYSAYDRDVGIGLYGNYDIDAISAFFNSSGTVIFSNEPTKVYQYTIINQIDFEKLIRFRTATVTFHVQPFKYSAIETMITHATVRQMWYQDTHITRNGVTVDVRGAILRISGESTALTEIYMPLNTMTFAPGQYTLNAESYSGSYPETVENVSIRLIRDTKAVTFCDQPLTLINNDTATLDTTITDVQRYNYL